MPPVSPVVLKHTKEIKGESNEATKYFLEESSLSYFSDFCKTHCLTVTLLNFALDD